MVFVVILRVGAVGLRARVLRMVVVRWRRVSLGMPGFLGAMAMVVADGRGRAQDEKRCDDASNHQGRDHQQVLSCNTTLFGQKSIHGLTSM